MGISVTEGWTQPGPFDSHGGFDADPIVHGFAKSLFATQGSAPLFARKRVPTRIGFVPARPGGVTEPPASPIF